MDDERRLVPVSEGAVIEKGEPRRTRPLLHLLERVNVEVSRLTRGGSEAPLLVGRVEPGLDCCEAVAHLALELLRHGPLREHELELDVQCEHVARRPDRVRELALEVLVHLESDRRLAHNHDVHPALDRELVEAADDHLSVGAVPLEHA